MSNCGGVTMTQTNNNSRKQSLMFKMANQVAASIPRGFVHEFKCPVCGGTARAIKTCTGSIKVKCEHMSKKEGC